MTKKASEYTATWRKRHPEQYKEYVKSWKKRNPDKIAKYKKSDRIKNKDKCRERSNKWRHNNPEKLKRQQYRQRYGITLEQYGIILGYQNGRCAICGRISEDKRLHIDHNHDNGNVRGLLCMGCNLSLGHLNTVEKLNNAITYVLNDGKAIEELLALTKAQKGIA